MTSHLKITTFSSSQTLALGERLAHYLSPGTILGFCGPLGAGKTTLIQGICKGLGVREKIVSPTFVLMHVYQGKMPVYHFDLYRLTSSDMEDLGWEEYLESPGISFIEWADRLGESFDFPHLQIHLEYGASENDRHFRFESYKSAFPWLKEFLSSFKVSA